MQMYGGTEEEDWRAVVTGEKLDRVTLVSRDIFSSARKISLPPYLLSPEIRYRSNLGKARFNDYSPR